MQTQAIEDQETSASGTAKAVVCSALVRLRSLAIRTQYRLLLWRVKLGQMPRKLMDRWQASRGETFRITLTYREKLGDKPIPVIKYARLFEIPEIGSNNPDGKGRLISWDVTRLSA